VSSEEGVILIGRKPTANYILAAVTQLGTTNRIVLKARGRAISKAVDTAEIVRRLKGDVKIVSCKIDSETVGEPGKERTVSTIEIVLEKE